MVTHLENDDLLIDAARNLAGHETQGAEMKAKVADLVPQALLDAIQKRQQAQIVQLFGTVDYDDDYDYKAARQKR